MSVPVPAAVLVPVFRDEEGLRVVLVARGDLGIHGGQVGLPGGKPEPGDATLLDTALRETEEEIGLPRRAIEVLSELEPMETRSTGFRVHPFLARVEVPDRWRLAAGEITAVLTPLATSLADPAAREETVLSFPARPGPQRVPGVSLDGGHTLWGLTLRVLDAVLPRLLAGEWAL